MDMVEIVNAMYKNIMEKGREAHFLNMTRKVL